MTLNAIWKNRMCQKENEHDYDENTLYLNLTTTCKYDSVMNLVFEQSTVKMSMICK